MEAPSTPPQLGVFTAWFGQTRGAPLPTFRMHGRWPGVTRLIADVPPSSPNRSAGAPAAADERPAEHLSNVVGRSELEVPPGPDWSGISFEVPCPKCGENLHGLTEPQCPHCQSRFDWGRVLPLDYLRCLTCDYRVLGLAEQRCPECGRPFEWPRVLAAARSRSSRLFERLWFDNPVPSLSRTWYLAVFRPSRLWAQQSRFDRVNLVPLLMFAALQIVVLRWGWPVMSWFATFSMNGLVTLLSDAGLVNRNLNFVYRLRATWDFLPRMVLWYVLTFVALQVFVQSKIRHGYDWRRLLRVYVHATAFAVFGPALACLLEMLMDLTYFITQNMGRYLTFTAYQSMDRAVFTLAILLTWRRLWIGFRQHLEAPRGWGAAGLALILGYLMASVAALFI